MKHLKFTLLFMLCTTVAFAQKQGNAWFFGDDAGLSFNSGSPVAVTTGQLYTNEGCASIADKKTGNVLFYTDGTSAWDKTNTVMAHGTSLGGNPSSTQSAVVVPMPGSDSLYYIFTVNEQAGFFADGSGGVQYCIVNMSLNGGLGDVSQAPTLLLTPTTEKIAATIACNDTDIWVVIHQWNSNAFYSYLVTKNGISAPVITNVGIVHQSEGSGDNAESIGYMKISPDGRKLALACYEDLNTVQIFDFDNTTGIMSNPITDTDYPNSSGADGPYGVSFSPDNTKLYVGYLQLEDPYSQVYQYNLEAGNSAAIVSSRVSVAESSATGQFGALQNGPDGKMYLANYGLDSLDVFESPNKLGAACNYVPGGVYLGGTSNLCTYGLPDIIENFLTPVYYAELNYPNCGSQQVLTLIDSALTGTITSYWNFGDPASGTSDTSTLQNPYHTFSSNGTYKVTVILTSPCQGTDTIVKSVVVKPSLVFKIQPAHPAVCSGNPVTLTAVGASTYQWSPSTALSATTGSSVIADPTEPQTYVIVGVDTEGCTSNDTITVNIGTGPSASFTMSSPNSCSPNQVQFTNTSTGDSTYLWLFGDGTTSTAKDPLHTYQSSQKYTITFIVTSPTGCTDTATQTESIITAEDFVLVPSAFAPVDKDGANQTFHPDVLCSGVSNYEFRVYNRWGVEVFETSDPTMVWDGKHNGTLQPLDVYAYYVAFDCGICKVSKKGNVTLVR